MGYASIGGSGIQEAGKVRKGDVVARALGEKNQTSCRLAGLDWEGVVGIFGARRSGGEV